jgi:negative regulator of sigma E activity
MKDSRFIELLNLYIDRQITAEETAELEAEIQQHPKRRAVYGQYCRIHSATKLAYQSFRVEEGESITPAGRAATIELFESRRRTPAWAYYVGGLAAAACVALVFARNSVQFNPAQEVAGTRSQPAVVATVPVAPVAAVPVAAMPTATNPNPVSLRNPVTTPDYSAMLAALREQDEERALASDRWHSGRVQSLFDDNLFEARGTVPAGENRASRSRTTESGQQPEFAAFQFQR